MNYKKKLIEYALSMEAINKASARKKLIRRLARQPEVEVSV